MSDPPQSTFRGGRYAVCGVLGEGAQATTYEAVDTQRGRRVALKQFRLRDAREWKSVELAERETRVLAELDHPLLPRYIEHFEEQGSLFLVMDKVEGETLAAAQRRGQVFQERDALALLRDAADALGYLHERPQPIVHRDIKPSNVLRRPDGRFSFVDFGSVGDRLRPQGGSTVVGTFGYMAPEQFQGRALPASDVYAVGATVLTLLTGVAPEQLPHRGLAVDVDVALRGKASAPMIRALRALLDPDPDRRPSRIDPVLHRLERELGSKRGAASPAPTPTFPSRKEAKRARRRARKEAARQRRDARRGARRERSPGRDHDHAFVPVVLLSALQVLVTVLLRVAIPLALRILSRFFGHHAFGRRLRTLADRVSDLATQATMSLRYADAQLRAHIEQERKEAQGVRVPPEAAPPAGVRVDVTSPGPDEEEWSEEASSRSERRAPRR